MHPAAEALIAELEAESPATRRVLERVPGNRLEWRPHPKSMSLGQLAQHVAALPGAICRMASQDGLDAATVDFEPEPAESAEALLTTFDGGPFVAAVVATSLVALPVAVYANLDTRRPTPYPGSGGPPPCA